MSERLVTRNLNTPHYPMHVVTVVNRDMLGAPIIPKSYRAFPPTKTAGKLRSRAPIHQEVQEWLALILRHTFKPDRIRTITIKAFAACFRVRTNDGVDIYGLNPIGIHSRFSCAALITNSSRACDPTIRIYHL